MIADSKRFSAYAKAIKKAVRPGDTVLEIGCGPGVFTLVAAQAGARRVYAIESDDVINVARRLAEANGLSERIEFIQGDSRRVELPERVNVVVADIRGILPLYDHAVPSIEDARERFLAPGGILIPRRDTLKAAVVDARKDYSRLVRPWQKTTRGMDFSASLSPALNEFYSTHFRRTQLLTEAESWYTLDYTTSVPRKISRELNLRVLRNGMAHGAFVWFESELFDGIGYSSGAGGATIYGHAFFPWLQPVKVIEGQEIQIALHADLVGQDYVWRWETKIPARDRRPDICFQQSTFQGATFSPESLRRRAVDYVPVLSDEGQAERWMLGVMDGRTSLQEIAQAAAERFPKIFPSSGDALRLAIELADKLSK
jgi:type I protein arginine methyltransferase